MSDLHDEEISRLRAALDAANADRDRWQERAEISKDNAIESLRKLDAALARAEAESRLHLDMMEQRDAARAEAESLEARLRHTQGIVASRDATLAAARIEAARYRGALERMLDTDPDDGTHWFHDVAARALEGEKP